MWYESSLPVCQTANLSLLYSPAGCHLRVFHALSIACHFLHLRSFCKLYHTCNSFIHLPSMAESTIMKFCGLPSGLRLHSTWIRHCCAKHRCFGEECNLANWGNIIFSHNHDYEDVLRAFIHVHIPYKMLNLKQKTAKPKFFHTVLHHRYSSPYALPGS